MTTSVVPARLGRTKFLVRETWASLAIAVIWLVVLFDAVLDQDIVTSNAGTNFTRIPSVILVVFFAYLATRVVARYGLGPGGTVGEDQPER